MSDNAACIFCRIVEGKEKASFVAQGSDAVAIACQPVEPAKPVIDPETMALIAHHDAQGGLV